MEWKLAETFIRNPKDHINSQTMISGVPVIRCLRTRMSDPCVYVAPIHVLSYGHMGLGALEQFSKAPVGLSLEGHPREGPPCHANSHIVLELLPYINPKPFHGAPIYGIAEVVFPNPKQRPAKLRAQSLKHKNLTFWFQGPTQRGYQKSWFVTSLCLCGLLGPYKWNAHPAAWLSRQPFSPARP